MLKELTSFQSIFLPYFMVGNSMSQSRTWCKFAYLIPLNLSCFQVGECGKLFLKKLAELAAKNTMNSYWIELSKEYC
jgi:hypothetical protein